MTDTKNPIPLTTREIHALCRLRRTPDERWVDWAVAMLLEGKDSPSLRIMAGETKPFYPFEFWALGDRVFSELGLKPFESSSDAGRALVMVRVRQILERVIDPGFGLWDIWRESFGLPEFSLLRNLHMGFTDLQATGTQWLFPADNRDEFLTLVDDECRRWLAIEDDVGTNGEESR